MQDVAWEIWGSRSGIDEYLSIQECLTLEMKPLDSSKHQQILPIDTA
jgi:hypothetical protein